MVANLAEKHFISEADYLEGEKISDIKHEYIDGEVYAMAGASRKHNIVSANIARLFGNHLENTPCATFIADLKVKAEGDFYYPDVLVACNDDEGDDYYTDSPIIIIEVLSKSTRRRDKVTKMNAYRTIPELKEYVLIEQNQVDVEVCRRSNNWFSEHYFLGDEVTFESIDLTLSVESIYQRVNNEDMQDYLQKLQSEKTES
ncbi:MAG: Uma2 family endonuclease [Methylococcaceae bacterium]|nr:Uma2 family endonuclease [Methylococcaceae bacterium]